MYLTGVGAKNIGQVSAMTTLEPFTRKGLNRMVEELVSLHEKGVLSDDEFQKLIRVVGANYIEQKISNRVNEAIEEKIYPNLLWRLALAR